jgi:alpha-galactosidase
LIEEFNIPLDEYPTRCIEQIAEWKEQAAQLQASDKISVEPSNEYAATLMNSIITGEPSTIYGNVINNGAIPALPKNCAVEVPCMVDSNGIAPTIIGDMPPQLIAMIRTNTNVQELVVAALMGENREHIFHAAMFDPHTAAELDVRQIRAMTEELIAAHGGWLPRWAQNNSIAQAAE